MTNDIEGKVREISVYLVEQENLLPETKKRWVEALDKVEEILSLTTKPLDEKEVFKLIDDNITDDVHEEYQGNMLEEKKALAKLICSHFSKPQIPIEEVYIVGIADCEGNEIIAVCTTKEIAEIELFKTRDRLIAEWKEADIRSQESIKKFCEEKNKEVWEDTMYRDMITALSGNDYEKWDNYPHDVPYICKMKVTGKERLLNGEGGV